MTNTFAGIRPNDVAGFIVVQLVGAFAAVALQTVDTIYEYERI